MQLLSSKVLTNNRKEKEIRSNYTFNVICIVKEIYYIDEL